MEHEMQPMHTCPEATNGDWTLLSECGDAALSTGGIVTIVIVILAIAGIGFGVWKWISGRS